MTDKPLGFFEGTEMPTAGWWEALWPDPVSVLVKVGIKSDMDVIDLCSGDGWFTLQIAKLARHVVAIDIDPTLLEIAHHRLAESNVGNYDFVAGDAFDIAQLWPRPVDFVFLANAFHGVPDRPRLARSVKASLKRAGRFAIINCIRGRVRKPSCWANRVVPELNCECHRTKQSKPSRRAVLNFPKL
jgi:ubiquinone/menaquinone biosynthesis C-methylase UbiE